MGLLNPFTKPAEPIDAPPPLGGSAHTPPDPHIRHRWRGTHACAIAGGGHASWICHRCGPSVCAIARRVALTGSAVGTALRMRHRWGPRSPDPPADLSRHRREPCLPLPVHHVRHVTLSH